MRFNTTLAVLTLTAAALLAGCSAVQTIPDSGDDDRAYLFFDVEPKSTRIFVDGDYKGEVQGWYGGAVPLEAGHRRLELRADGYMDRRFDVHLEPGDEKTLVVQMERKLEDFEDPDSSSQSLKSSIFTPTRSPTLTSSPDPKIAPSTTNSTGS